MTTKPPAPSRRSLLRAAAVAALLGAVKVCPGCGALNGSNAKVCSKCRGDLKLGDDGRPRARDFAHGRGS